MAEPLLQAQIDINAPVPTVWALISDFNRMPQWSPQCRLMKALGPVRQGTRTININRRNFLFWLTTSTVTPMAACLAASTMGSGSSQRSALLRTRTGSAPLSQRSAR